MKLSGWGRFPVHETTLTTPRDPQALRATLGTNGPALIARGMGRAYGDAAVGVRTVSMQAFNKMVSFDATTGTLTAEAGVTLGDIIDAFLPRGWFLSVTPGTKFVSLGGAIAADVHGKNHHKEGSFGAFVDWIDVMGADGQVTRASREQAPELFHQTLGGMGLTGIILRAAIRLRRVSSGWIRQRTIAATNLDAAIAAFEDNLDALYSVAWIDGLAKGNALGRSLVTFGNHAERQELPADQRLAPFDAPHWSLPSVPFNLPGFALNSLSVRAFNALYYFRGARKPSDALVSWDSYFYPLDSIGNWNRIYGRKGFMQYQCVLPLTSSADGLRALLEQISASGAASFLAVLKRFGPQDSALSFPMEGYTLALDFPNTARGRALMPRLDEITAHHGGRLYLAKDSRMSAATLRQTDARWEAFSKARAETGLQRHFASAQSKRLDL